MNQKNKGKALESELRQIEKQFGKVSLMKSWIQKYGYERQLLFLAGLLFFIESQK